MEMEASESFSVCLANMTVNANTSDGSVTLILCQCEGDSIDGVHIKNVSKKNVICIVPDTNVDEPTVYIYDGQQYCDSLIIRKDKRRPVLMKYEKQSRTWSLIVK